MKNTKVKNATYKDTILISFPSEVTVRDVESLLLQKSEAAKKSLIFVIFHRLNNRYVLPLNEIPDRKRSGFLTMAAACLMIEAFQSFREGREYTKDKGAGKECFQNFFSSNKAFRELIPYSDRFYSNIRCGILHQAETYENWLLITGDENEPLFDPKDKSINADLFLKELANSFGEYRHYLIKADWNHPLWKAAKFKLDKICEHCQAIPVKKTIWSYCI